jgi:hypothetical protein
MPKIVGEKFQIDNCGWIGEITLRKSGFPSRFRNADITVKNYETQQEQKHLVADDRFHLYVLNSVSKNSVLDLKNFDKTRYELFDSNGLLISKGVTKVFEIPYYNPDTTDIDAKREGGIWTINRRENVSKIYPAGYGFKDTLKIIDELMGLKQSLLPNYLEHLTSRR